MSDSSHRQFDYETISDVIIHLRYTAKEDTNLKQPSIDNLKQVIQDAATSGFPLSIFFDVKHEFADEWHKFVNATADNTELIVSISKDMLPFFALNYNMEVIELLIFAKKKDSGNKDDISLNSGQKLVFDQGLPYSVNLFKETIKDVNADITDANDFTYLIEMDKITAKGLENMFFIMNYRLF